jgi:hypothetical protein
MLNCHYPKISSQIPVKVIFGHDSGAEWVSYDERTARLSLVAAETKLTTFGHGTIGPVRHCEQVPGTATVLLKSPAKASFALYRFCCTMDLQDNLLFQGEGSMTHEMTVMLTGYMGGVVFGSIISISIYRVLIETGRLKPFGVK